MDSLPVLPYLTALAAAKDRLGACTRSPRLTRPRYTVRKKGMNERLACCVMSAVEWE